MIAVQNTAFLQNTKKSAQVTSNIIQGFGGFV